MRNRSTPIFVSLTFRPLTVISASRTARALTTAIAVSLLALALTLAPFATGAALAVGAE